MNVLICVNNSLRYCPYVNYYTKICEENGHTYSVIYPDRGNLKEVAPYNTIRFAWNEKRSSAIQLLQYSFFASKELMSKKYDFAIVITTGAAVLLARALEKNKGKFILDIRDYTRENNWIYYLIEKRIIRKARCVVLSSPYFREFLPEHDYLDIYNVPASVNEERRFRKREKGTIIISYIGSIAYPVQCESLMKLVEEDDRFRFYLYGNDLNGDRISKHINEKGYKHSKYFGPYAPDEKEKLICETDILFNAYGNGSKLLEYALSNKLTDAAIYKKVVLNSPRTCMDKELKGCSFAIDFTNSTDLNKLYEWYINLDSVLVENSLHNLLMKILRTNKETEMRIKQELSKHSL